MRRTAQLQPADEIHDFADVRASGYCRRTDRHIPPLVQPGGGVVQRCHAGIDGRTGYPAPVPQIRPNTQIKTLLRIPTDGHDIIKKDKLPEYRSLRLSL